MSSGWHILWPWIWLLLPIPWLLMRLSPAGPALMIADDHALASTGAQRRFYLSWPAALVWILILSAACRPQWVDAPIIPPTEGRDLVLAIDISPSMDKADMRYRGNLHSRIDAVKGVIGEFLQRRRGDRMALILFGTQPYWYIPLTYDLATLHQLLNEAEAGWAGKRTAIGEAVLLAASRLRDQGSHEPTLILLTDGINNAGTNLEDAGIQARQDRLKIYSIGFGSGQMRGWLSGDELDEEALIRLAEQTRGRYFRARDPHELEQIYSEIDQLEALPQPRPPYYPRLELFHWPLIAAFVLCLLALAVGWGQRFRSAA